MPQQGSDVPLHFSLLRSRGLQKPECFPGMLRSALQTEQD